MPQSSVVWLEMLALVTGLAALVVGWVLMRAERERAVQF